MLAAVVKDRMQQAWPPTLALTGALLVAEQARRPGASLLCLTTVTCKPLHSWSLQAG